MQVLSGIAPAKPLERAEVRSTRSMFACALCAHPTSWIVEASAFVRVFGARRFSPLAVVHDLSRAPYRPVPCLPVCEACRAT